tara:strand:+ start:81 stop:716 length:636 start_codon:yes stop_codon:yes gene_type:complete
MKQKIETLSPADIISIFPTPVYRCSFSRQFSPKEKTFFDSQLLDLKPNVGNKVGTNTYILNTKPLRIIKKELEIRLQDYLEKVLNAESGTKLYITQSWMNHTAINEWHHEHTHPNSYVSGVLYLNADKKNDKIFFDSHQYPQITPSRKTYNAWNTSGYWLPVETGNLIMFPSGLAHRVDHKKGTNDRVSLSFNTFIKGKLGSSILLTELKL